MSLGFVFVASLWPSLWAGAACFDLEIWFVALPRAPLQGQHDQYPNSGKNKLYFVVPHPYE